MSDSSLKKGRFTKFSNRIGLYSKQTGNYIANTPEVVLNYPFKDAVLEAGMNKEDVGRDERFLHTEIDWRDIDTLFEPKVLTSFKYIDESGESIINSNSDIEFFDENDNLKQNLLIKGNNLLALHSLKRKLSGKIKLIYIDPPYFFRDDKNADTFKYNSNFKLSSWLCFMKNRLDVARELLSDDGMIFVSISDDGQAYLRVLMDEVFGVDNFISNIVWEKKKKPSFLANIGGITEFVIAFAKNRLNAPILTYGETTKGKKYPLNNAGNSLNTLTFPAHSVKFNLVDQAIQPQDMSEGRIKTKLLNELIIKDGVNDNEFKLEGEWRYSQSKLDEIIANGEQIVISKIPFRPNHIKEGGTPKKMGNLLDVAHYGMATYEDATDEADKLFGSSDVFNYSKPEKLLSTLIASSTDEGDIVLDFCLGSGTTSAVAHKMNRRWIGIEQMDYIETVSKERLKKVIDGEQGGISKDVNWQGGGSFVYMELKKYNQDFLDRLMEVTSISDVEAVYEDMQKNAFLKFFFDKKEFEKDENFRSKTWEERRDMLVEILDENQLYLNLQDMRDSKHKVSNDEMVLTDRFYGVNEDAES